MIYVSFRFVYISMRISKVTLLVGLLAIALATPDCGPGGIPCPSGTCHYPAYIEGCHVYQSSESCYECEYNYVKCGNICKYSPPFDTSDCCLAYGDSGECEKCATGLSLRDGICKDIKITGCIQKTKSGDCYNCALDYELYGGQCFKKIPGCEGYRSTGECQRCNENYDLQYGLCIPRFIIDTGCHEPFVLAENGQCQIPHCDIVFDFGCASCHPEFRLLPDGTCRRGVIEGCESYEFNGYCKKCKQPVYQLYQGTCLSVGCIEPSNDGKCQKCNRDRGFYLTNDGYCKIQNCVVSSYNECLVCEAGYVEVNGICQLDEPAKMCTVCRSTQYLGQDGVCHNQEPGCVEYNRGRCSQCEESFYLSRDYTCEIKQLGCIYTNGRCTECRFPFKMTAGGQCSIEGCSVIDTRGCDFCEQPYVLTESRGCTFENCLEVEQGRCLQCQDGYLLKEDGFCLRRDPNCRKYDFNGICLTCDERFYLNEQGRCVQANFGCNYISGRCASCRAPFEYNPQQQTCFIDGCLDYFIGGCQVCAAEYDLRYNSCKLPHCLISHNGHCKECDPDYIMRSDGKCVNKDEFCWNYDEDGFCTECAPKYFLSKLTNKCKLREPGCRYDDNDRCIQCDEPFFFDGVRCEIAGCLDLGFEGCKQCFYPMEVTYQGLCSVVNCERMEGKACALCKPGFFLARDGSCKVQDPKCLVYGPTYCEKCVKGYRLDRNGRCQYADEHCWDFTLSGVCTNCDRLYFLNSHKKCEIKDQYCNAYSGGRCIECKQFSYLHRGICYPNAKGCLKQKNIKQCELCEDGYSLDFGVCSPKITKLSWNSIDMDFWDDETDFGRETSEEIFTRGKTNKLNLDPAIYKGKGRVFFSSCRQDKDRSFQVDDYQFNDGWTCQSSHPRGQYLGVELDHMETFYALDIKAISSNSLKKFAVEYSENGRDFIRIQEFQMGKKTINGVVQTFYFTPVFARSIRIVVIEGIPNIKFEFYYSNGENKYAQKRETYISQTIESIVEDELHGQIFQTQRECIDQELCWMGLEVCQPKEIKGFALSPNEGSTGAIQSVVIKYSTDGVKFSCYYDCQQISLSEYGAFSLDPTFVALKMRIYPATWTGNPKYSVTFNY